MNLGLRPYNFEFIYEASSLLKKDLLYFDQIHICRYDDVLVLDDLKIMNPEYYDILQGEFSLLKQSGLLCEFNLTEMLEFTVDHFTSLKGQVNEHDFIDMGKIMAEYGKMPKPGFEKIFGKYPGQRKAKKILKEYRDSVDEVESEATRISANFLTRFSTRDEAFPLLFNDQPVGADPFHQAKVLEVVLEKLPIPNENVDWKQIVEYRADPDSSTKFNALRVWMQDIARKDYTKNEIEERIEYLINDYERHLQLHELKFRHSTVQVFVTTTLELLENLAKFNLSKVAKALFSFKEKQYDLLESEMNSPGKEIAYISKTQNTFGR